MDNDIEIWKIKKLLKSLESFRGNGTSMISLIIPSKGQISLVNKMLTDEYGTATNIKSRVNKLSVLSAITSTQQKLKLYKKTPDNGLVIYSGTVINEEGKEKKVNIDFEPFKPVNKSLYKCDNKFHVENLKELLISSDKYAFIIMDGNGCLYATLAGNDKQILNQFKVDLPKKHGRGGQSALRFARLRLEARYNYLKKVCEIANNLFLKDNKATVKGIVLAGSADFKNQIIECDIFSYVLKEIVIKSVDVAYGGLIGLNQAIDLASDDLKDVVLTRERKVISSFFEHISKDTQLYCFGINDTIYALEMGGVEKLIIYEDLKIIRQELKSKTDNTTKIAYIDPDEEIDNTEFEIVDKIELIEWFTLKYKEFGAELILISDRSQEGNQFIKGFGGIGGILRWEVKFDIVDNILFNDDENNKDDYIFM